MCSLDAITKDIKPMKGRIVCKAVTYSNKKKQLTYVCFVYLFYICCALKQTLCLFTHYFTWFFSLVE